MAPFGHPQWHTWGFSNMADQFPTYSQFPNYSGFLADSLEAYQTQQNRLVQHQQMSRNTESKPRLSKEEVEVLEAEFQKNHKPSSSTKKALAESMRVDNARINNWFQNRRAREKKENNIKEYQAKQQLEKERSESGQGPQPAKNHQRDLVASSAPFYQPATNLKQSSDASLSPTVASVPDESSDAGQTSDSSPTSPLSLPREMKHDHVRVGTVDAGDEGNSTCTPPDQMKDYLAMQEKSMLHLDRSATSQYSGRFEALETIQQSVENYDNDHDADLSPSSSSPLADESDVASPDDIGGNDLRPNHRPTPLTIGGGRGNNSYTTRINDTMRKGSQEARMRRVSSTSSGRVTKSLATPRSPFFDRNAANLLQRLPSPHRARRQESAAPPTPDTPVSRQPHESLSAPAFFTLEGKYTPPDVAIPDPTLGTPPTTPGFSDGLFHLGSGYELSMSEEALISLGMGGLHTGMGMVGNATNFANYMPNVNQCSAQRMAPMYQAQLSQSYIDFDGSGRNPGHNWSNPSMSTASNFQQQRYVTLNTMDH